MPDLSRPRGRPHAPGCAGDTVAAAGRENALWRPAVTLGKGCNLRRGDLRIAVVQGPGNLAYDGQEFDSLRVGVLVEWYGAAAAMTLPGGVRPGH